MSNQNRLIPVHLHTQRKSAAAGPGVLGHELHRNPAQRVPGRGRRVWPEDPRRTARTGHRHVVLGEHLDRTVTVVGGIDRRGAIGDRAAPAAASEAGKRGRQPLELRAAGFDDDLECDDFVTGGDQADCTAVPHRIPQPVGVLAIVTLHFHAVVHGPDRERSMLRRVVRGQARRSNGQCGDPRAEPRSGHHSFPAIALVESGFSPA